MSCFPPWNSGKRNYESQDFNVSSLEERKRGRRGQATYNPVASIDCTSNKPEDLLTAFTFDESGKCFCSPYTGLLVVGAIFCSSLGHADHRNWMLELVVVLTAHLGRRRDRSKSGSNK